MNTMTLKDGSVIDILAGASLGNIRVASADMAAMAATWGNLTAENLAEVTFKNDAGMVCAIYTDLVLVSETSTIGADGTITTSFQFREKTDIEKQLEEMQKYQEVQDGAISDLGAVTSTLAEQLKGDE